MDGRPFSCCLQTIIPDYLFGDPIPLEAMATGRANLEEWRSRHTQAVTRPILDNVINALKEQGVKRFAAVGFCFGGKWWKTRYRRLLMHHSPICV